jgi:hypothetical protein
MKSRIGNTLDRNGCEHIDAVGERDLREPRIQGDSLNALYRLAYLARVIAASHVVFDERPHHAYREARLRDANGVSLGWNRIQVAQPALEHVQRVQDIDWDAIRQGDLRSTFADGASVKTDDPGEEIDLLDAVGGL